MPKHDPGTVAEYRIASLGITDPADIDVEAIAFDAQVDVRYEQLDGCAATLVGGLQKAIATIRPSGLLERDRFSVAHELGHWDLHRGRSFVCRLDDVTETLSSGKPLEREADEYAAHLLMPGPLFKPFVKQLKQPGFEQLHDLRLKFRSSLLACALRLVGVDTEPAVLIYFDAQGRRRWFRRAPSLPRYWFPGEVLDKGSYSADVLQGEAAPARPRKQEASMWFDNVRGEPELLEHCVGYLDGVLTLLYLTDESML